MFTACAFWMMKIMTTASPIVPAISPVRAPLILVCARRRLAALGAPDPLADGVGSVPIGSVLAGSVLAGSVLIGSVPAGAVAAASVADGLVLGARVLVAEAVGGMVMGGAVAVASRCVLVMALLLSRMNEPLRSWLASVPTLEAGAVGPLLSRVALSGYGRKTKLAILFWNIGDRFSEWRAGAS